MLILVQVCDSAVYYEPFWKHYFNYSEDSLINGTKGVPKHVGEAFVHLLCVYCSVFKVGFISWFLHYAQYMQY
jgi:cellobiose-specific phosphotransferase system component IIC